MKWKLKGGHKQETRSGKNKIPLSSAKTINGVNLSVDEKGIYTLSGTATGDCFFSIPLKSVLTADVSRTMSLQILDGTASTTGAFYLAFRIRNSSGVYGEAELRYKSGTSKYTTKTITTECATVEITVVSGTTLNNIKLAIQLEDGTKATSIEQYGMMPSTDYPSEIETVGSNVQLFDKDNVNKLNGVPDVSSITSSTVSKSFYVQAKPNTTYTVSRKIIGSRFVVGTTANLPAVGETIIDRKVNNEGSSITLTTSKNVNYLVVYYLYNSGENEEEILDNIKLEKGSTATPWSPHGMGSVGIDVVNKILLNIANTKETTKGGITYSIKNGILKLNGTATADFDIQLSKNIKMKKGKYTHSSSYIQSGLYISFDNLGYTMISSTVGKKKTFEITEDTTYKTYFIWINKGTVLSNVEIKLQLEVGDTATDFVEHQSQTAIMPVQQEMLQGDYIEDVEHHEWGKLVLKGNNVWEKVSNSYQNKTTYFQTQSFDNLLKTEEIISNYFTKKRLWEKDVEGIVCDPSRAYSLRIRVNKTIASTSSELNAYLKARYDANDPVVIYYKLANAIDLELTEAQKAVREQKLHTYKNVTNINLSDELASIDVTYKKDLDTILNNLQAQIITNASEEV